MFEFSSPTVDLKLIGAGMYLILWLLVCAIVTEVWIFSDFSFWLFVYYTRLNHKTARYDIHFLLNCSEKWTLKDLCRLLVSFNKIFV